MSIIKSIKLSNTKYDLNDARISSNDITNWNGKTSNVGTVVGIQMNGGSTISPDSDGIIDLGTLITSHQSISGKADKVSNPTSGNFAGLDSNGNLTDSGSKASDFASSSDVTAIEEKIPTQASSSNLLADKNFVNSSISTATATFQGTYNLVNDLSLTTSATESGIVTALATEVSSADNNDYVFVLIPTADGTPTEISHVDRYKYNGTAWAYEYTLNNSSFTSAQWAAINSGITSSIVSAISDKYELPSGGIPATDLATAVLTSLGLADTAVQPSALNDYVTLATDLNITGVKTFLGLKKIAFKQATSSDKLGFTLFANDGTEKGYLEFNGSNKVDNIPLMTLGNYASAAAGLTQIGFRKYSSISGASGAYNLIAPLISDARTPFSLTTTYTNFYLPLGFTDGTTTVKTAKTGVVDLSSLLPDISGKADAATTLSGYGITDAKIENGVITLGSNSITPLTSHQDISGKADKVSSATNGNFAGLDSNGNLTDSGKKASDFQTALSALTAYTSKGTNVKVPQITTNSLGQVTSITEVDINFPEQKTFEEQYLTIVSLEDINAIGWKTTDASNTKTVSVSTDNGVTWTSKTSATGGTTLATLNNGDRLLIKGSNSYYGTESSGNNYFTSSKNFNVEGNIMSIIYGDNFTGQTTLTENYALARLFNACQYLISAENLILPATTLSDYCYYSLFGTCTNLEKAPVLPATTLATACYYCMFFFCSSLTTAPELLAPTLTESCYNWMFRGCDNLNYIKCLATDISANVCLTSWVANISATGTFVKADNMSSWTIGDNGIPSGWNAYSESDYAYVRHYELSNIGGDNIALFSTDDGVGIVPEDGIKVNTITSAASMTIVADKVNVISGNVGTATITLQVPSDNLAHVWDILMTTDSSVDVTIVTSTSATIKKPFGFTIGESKSCEINVIGVGNIFYLRYGEFT